MKNPFLILALLAVVSCGGRGEKKRTETPAATDSVREEESLLDRHSGIFYHEPLVALQIRKDRFVAQDRVYESGIRYGDTLSAEEIYTDTFAFLDGDTLTISLLKDHSVYTLVADELRDVLTGEGRPRPGQYIDVDWTIGFAASAEDSTLMRLVKTARRIAEPRFDIAVRKDADSIVVDGYDYSIRGDRANYIDHDEDEYEKYGLNRMHEIWNDAEPFRHDDLTYSFDVLEQIEIHPDVRSLLIRSLAAHSICVWLVNYDGSGNYVDSIPIGYDEWAEGWMGMSSVIRLGPEPYIEREYREVDTRETSRVEIGRWGKMEVVETVLSSVE